MLTARLPNWRIFPVLLLYTGTSGMSFKEHDPGAKASTARPKSSYRDAGLLG